MSYNYQIERPGIFTDKGQKEFILVRDKAFKLLKEAGAFKMFYVMDDLGAYNAWTAMAYVDRMVEIGDIVEVTDKLIVAGQDRIFIKEH